MASLDYSLEDDDLVSFEDNCRLAKLGFAHYEERGAAIELLRSGGITCSDGDIKIPDQYCLENQLKGPVEIEGPFREGRSVDLVFINPVIKPLDFCKLSELVVASIDIETDESTRSIRAIALSVSTTEGKKYAG